MNRRYFLRGLVALVAAPAAVACTAGSAPMQPGGRARCGPFAPACREEPRRPRRSLGPKSAKPAEVAVAPPPRRSPPMGDCTPEMVW